MNARAGADVDEVVRGAHGVLVMLHHDEAVAQIPEVFQRRQQLIVVPLVQPDGRLVQNIQHPHQAAANLGSQPDPLALAAGEGPGAAGQRQIAETHGLQKAQPGANFLQNAVGDQHLLLRQRQPIHPGKCILYGEGGELVDVLLPHRDRQGFLPQTAALTVRAGTLTHQLLQLFPAGIGLGLLIAALNVVADTLKGLLQNTLAPGLVVVQLQCLPLGAVEDDVFRLIAETVPRLRQGKLVLFAQSVEVHPGNAVPPNVVPAAGLNRPVQNGLSPVLDHEGGIGLQLVPQTGTGGAGAEGIVEGEHPGSQLLHGDTAILAGVVLGEGEVLFLPQKVDDHQSAGELGGGLHAVRQPLADVRSDDEPVHDDLDGVLFVLL